MQMSTLTKFLLLGLVAGALSACGVIPKAYRGEYVDEAKGARIQLQSKKGRFIGADGAKVEAKALDLGFDGLSEGKSGIYVAPNPVQGSVLDVFWIEPAAATRQSAGGLVWFEADVLYAGLDAAKGSKVSSFDVMRCAQGTVLLDTQTRHWQVGCPAETESFHFVRVK